MSTEPRHFRQPATNFASSATQPPRIVVAEDHPVCSLVLQHHLAALGQFDLVTCASGVEAWRAWRHAPTSLVITDLDLPGMDGITLARTIRAFEGALDRRTAIVALTASCTPTQRVHCVDAGFDELHVKPLEFDTLAGMIKLYLA